MKVLADITPVELVDQALDRLQTQGWRQGENGPVDGTNCLNGALWYGLMDLSGVTELSNSFAFLSPFATVVKAINRTLGITVGDGFSGWNDRPERTAEDVLLLLKQVRVDLEMEAGEHAG